MCHSFVQESLICSPVSSLKPSPHCTQHRGERWLGQEQCHLSFTGHPALSLHSLGLSFLNLGGGELWRFLAKKDSTQ